MRLNAFLARTGAASRRGADELIKSGRVTVNGKLGQLNSEISANDDVRLDGKPLKSQTLRYILLNKPAGVLTTLKDPHGRRKVSDLLNIAERIVPVGRLDYDTTGALLLTNDGELAHKLMHPRFEVDKVYEAEVQGHITQEILNKLSVGIQLQGGKTAPAEARKINENKIELIIHEGRKHQVKRMLAAVGLPTKKLHRSKYGPLNLESLKPGQRRNLTPAEIRTLRNL